jgi:hypothetical protein
MDLSLVSVEEMIKEISRRCGIEIIVAMDAVASQEYFECPDVEVELEGS